MVALINISTLMGLLSILTPCKALVALTACSALLKMTVALPRLLPLGPYWTKTRRGLPTLTAVLK